MVHSVLTFTLAIVSFLVFAAREVSFCLKMAKSTGRSQIWDVRHIKNVKGDLFVPCDKKDKDAKQINPNVLVACTENIRLVPFNIGTDEVLEAARDIKPATTTGLLAAYDTVNRDGDLMVTSDALLKKQN